MQKPKSKFKDASSEVIERNFLEENPEGLKTTHRTEEEQEGVQVATYVPTYRRVQFINGRDPGCPLEFHYHTKTHPRKKYILFHGKDYDLPEEVISHLEDCAIPQYAYRVNPYSGAPEAYAKSMKYLYQLRNATSRQRI